MASTSPVTHKFGGSSVADAERYGRVLDILLKRDENKQLVVVSAMQGVTDALIRLGTRAGKADPKWKEDFAALHTRHLDTSRALLGRAAKPHLLWLDDQFSKLESLLASLQTLGPSRDGLEFVQGLGEVFSARLLTAAFNARRKQAVFLDAREVLVVRSEELGVMVEWGESQKRFDAWRRKNPSARIVATGFVARDATGRATTLGRNGSDYSAAIFGALASSPEILIWTDVDGVLSADPRLVPEAVLLESLSYSEACELAYFGAKVIHPQTMAPAIARKIPLRICNTFAPEKPGSIVSSAVTRTPPVKGLTTFGNLAVVNVEGAGMIGVPGTSERVFGALNRAGVSVVMISQGSSEHSICLVVEQKKADHAVQVLREAFAVELKRGALQSVSAQPDVTLLAAVGDGMAGTRGIAARLFDSLARSDVNVRAIAQGSSERNISVAIDSKDAVRALRAVHAGFWLSPQTISLGIIGPGRVGKAFIGQLAAAQKRLRETANLDLKVRALATSKKMVLVEKEIDLSRWQDALAEGVALDLKKLAAHVRAPHLPHAAIVDCTASDVVADHYPSWLDAGIHVITPAKHAGAGPWKRYQAIKASRSSGARFLSQASCGAGLPILTTLRDLLDTGDQVLAVEGLLSGTLAWLFNKYDGTVPFSTLVKEAHQLGYTEPDPRDDLSGTDVARKLVILAREMGEEVALDDVKVTSLVPPSLSRGSATDFLKRVSELDAPMKKRFDAARKKGRVLRFVARVEKNGKARVGLTELAPDHPFAHGRLTDNVVQFTSNRYRNNPLVVQGPGAGPEVTAGGVFADVLRLAKALGARV
jgi:bifunctional aspartokinase / homoserine dehydrogenase 1